LFLCTWLDFSDYRFAVFCALATFNNEDFVNDDMLDLLMSQWSLEHQIKKPKSLKDMGAIEGEHTSMCFYLCVFEAIKDTIDPSIAQSATDLK